LADASSGWPELPASWVSAESKARPIPFDGSALMSPPVSDFDGQWNGKRRARS
jgi:hypothetical protein